MQVQVHFMAYQRIKGTGHAMEEKEEIAGQIVELVIRDWYVSRLDDAFQKCVLRG